MKPNFSLSYLLERFITEASFMEFIVKKSDISFTDWSGWRFVVNHHLHLLVGDQFLIGANPDKGIIRPASSSLGYRARFFWRER